MGKNERVQNYLDAIHFNRPDWIPAGVSLLPGAWLKHGEAMEEVVLDHPRLFPGYKQGGFRDMRLSRQYQKGRWTDAWGVVWHNAEDGISSTPVESEAPLQDWAAFDAYEPPNPLEVDDHGDPVDWDQRGKGIAHAKESGGLASGGLIHGFMFMRLFYLRGFSNFMMDVGTHDPRLGRLIDMVLSHNVAQVRKYLELGIEHLSGGDDMGMQTALPIRPGDWVHYMKPCFEAIFGPCRDRGVSVYLHSDGHILEIIPHLVECGVKAINPQVRANTLDGLARVAKGRVCINLDLDRQLFPFATPDEVRAHIREAKQTLYMPEGGLMLNAECAPDVPVDTVRAICETLEEVGCGPR